jgi:hypothetical protein
MSVDSTEAPCPRCGKPRAEWTENDGAGVAHDGLTYCSARCAAEDRRPESTDQGDVRVGGGPEPGAAAGPEAAGSPAAAPSSPSLEGSPEEGPRPLH